MWNSSGNFLAWCSTTSRGGTIWSSSLRRPRRPGCLYISASVPTFAESGISGVYIYSSPPLAKNHHHSENRLLVRIIYWHCAAASSLVNAFDLLLFVTWLVWLVSVHMQFMQRLSGLAEVCSGHQLQDGQRAFQGPWESSTISGSCLGCRSSFA